MKTYKIGYCGIAKDCFEIYIISILHKYTDINIEIIDDFYNEYCDMIVYTPLVPHEYLISNHISYYIHEIMKPSINYNIDKVKFLCISGEPHAFPNKDYNEINTDNNFLKIKRNDYSISHTTDSPTNCFIPYIYYELFNIQNQKTIAERINKSKDIFCSIISSTNSIHRQKYIDFVSYYKPVEIYGQISNDTNRHNISEEMIQTIYESSKFNLAIENSISIEGESYITEKIAKAYRYGCIPIYFGSDYVYEIFNEKTFIDAKKYDEDELREIIRNINKNDDLYNNIINQPIYKNPNFNYYLYFHNKLIDFMYNLLTKE